MANPNHVCKWSLSDTTQEQGDPFETFQPEKQDYLFRRPYILGVFQLDEPQKRYIPTAISGIF